MYMCGDSQNHSNLRVLKISKYGELKNDSNLRVPINVHLWGPSKALKFEGPYKCTFMGTLKMRVFDMPLQAHGMSGRCWTKTRGLRQACLSPKKHVFSCNNCSFAKCLRAHVMSGRGSRKRGGLRRGCFGAPQHAF